MESLEDGAPAFRGCTGLAFSLERRRSGHDVEKNISFPTAATDKSNLGRYLVKTMLKVHERGDCQKNVAFSGADPH